MIENRNDCGFMSRVQEIKSSNRKLTQKQTAKKMKYSAFTFKSFFDEIKITSPQDRRNTERKRKKEMSSQMRSMNSSRVKRGLAPKFKI